MSKSTNTCQTGKIAVNNAAKFDHFFSKPNKKIEYFLTSAHSKINAIIENPSKSISGSKKVYLAKKSTIKIISK